MDDAHARVAGDPAVDLVPHGSVEEDVERALLPRPPVRVQHHHARPHCQSRGGKEGLINPKSMIDKICINYFSLFSFKSLIPLFPSMSLAQQSGQKVVSCNRNQMCAACLSASYLCEKCKIDLDQPVS